MSKIAIIYWTGTGNTLEMARAIEKGAKDAGATVEVFEVESFGGVDRLKEYDGLMFGCPAMGDEVLEEGAVLCRVREPSAGCARRALRLLRLGRRRLDGVLGRAHAYSRGQALR